MQADLQSCDHDMQHTCFLTHLVKYMLSSLRLHIQKGTHTHTVPVIVDMLLMEVAAAGAEGAADGAVDRATDEVTALYKACRQQPAQHCY